MRRHPSPESCREDLDDGRDDCGMEELWRYWNQTALLATYEQAGEPADTAETPPQPAGPGPGLS